MTAAKPQLIREIVEVEINSEPEGVGMEGRNSGELTMKSTYEFHREKGLLAHWENFIWRSFLPPKLS